MSETESPPVPMDKLARVYIRIRERVAELTKAHETQVELLKAQQAEVANAMKEQLRANGELSSKTVHGTVSLITKTRFVAQDADAFRAFVLENGAIDLLEMRIVQKNMTEFLEKNPGNVPPGLNTLSSIEISVRKPTK